MGAVRLRSLARALPALLVWAAGCEALVNGQLGDVRCQVEGAVGPPGCPTGSECHAGLCVPSPLGVPCAADADCSPGDFCLDPALFGAVVPDGGAAPAPRCSRACCTSDDCGADGQQVCWVPPAGGVRVCWPAAAAGRAATGAAPAWQSCAADGDCRSGRCTGGRCADTCCSDTSCLAGDGACRYAVPPAAETTGFWCAVATTGTAPRYSPCKSGADCASGLCTELEPGILRCSSPCCTSDECESLAVSAAGEAVGTPVRCVTLPGGGGTRACAALGSGTALVGTVCVADADCRSGTCLGALGHKRCSDACCSDASCNNPTSLVCRPVDLDNAWALQCEPK